MRKLFMLSILALAIGCQSGTEKTISSDSATLKTNDGAKENTPIHVAGCYMEILKRDTFTAHIMQQGNTISGRLVFNNYEKDASTGSVTGLLEGDILKLKYRFSSEGMSSVMELYYQSKNGNLVRGIGDMATKGDSTFFMNTEAIKYEGSVLSPYSCEILPAKYR